MNRVRRVLPLFHILIAEVSEIRREGIPVQKQDVVSVDLPDRIVETIVVLDETDVLRFCGFVKRVVAGDPFVVFVVGRELFPQPDDSILMVLVVPEICDMPSVVGVPVCVLTAGSGV